MSTKRERVDLVNEFVKVISNNGRRFFHHNGAVAKIELTKRGHLFWHDEYSKVRIYVGRPGKWCGFNNGGTLRRLVECLAEFVRKEQQISTYYFGEHWAYRDSIQVVIEAGLRLGILIDRPREC